ncbi:MAG TPA: hypothetical protein VFR23_24595 [Jiangellaceae bacterium]|nr:hypothetical protein [Jiangellaceae bacterium]
MALNPKTAVAARNAALDAAFDTLNGDLFGIFDGTQPTNADTALGAQTLLAELTLNATAFAAASSGSKAANAITQDSSANATGTASWASLYATARTTVGTMDMEAGTSGANLNLNSVAISSGAAVSCSSLTITQAA